jgi:hypothetical protein
MANPWEVLPAGQERSPPMSEMSMAPPLGGTVGDPGAPTTYVGDVDSGPPWGSVIHPGSERCVVNLHEYHRQK